MWKSNRGSEIMRRKKGTQTDDNEKEETRKRMRIYTYTVRKRKKKWRGGEEGREVEYGAQSYMHTYSHGYIHHA